MLLHLHVINYSYLTSSVNANQNYELNLPHLHMQNSGYLFVCLFAQRPLTLI